MLAHLHLATLLNSSLLGNSIADFVRGDPYTQYDKDIADGIMLHRKIDRLTDVLPEINQAKLLFIPEHRRVAPITLDIVWDHFLSLHWSQFNPHISLSEFSLSTKLKISPYMNNLSVDYQNFMQHLWQENWFEKYAEIDFIADVLAAMARRRPKLSQLKEIITDIKHNYNQLESRFFQYYPILLVDSI